MSGIQGQQWANDTLTTSFTKQQHLSLVIVHVVLLCVSLGLAVVLALIYLRTFIQHLRRKAIFSSTMEQDQQLDALKDGASTSTALMLRARHVSPFLFVLFVAAASLNQILFSAGSMVHLSLPDPVHMTDERAGQLWIAAGVIQVLFSFPLFFGAMLSSLFQAIQLGVFRDIQEYLKRLLSEKLQSLYTQTPVVRELQTVDEPDKVDPPPPDQLTPSTEAVRGLRAKSITVLLLKILRIVASTKLQIALLLVVCALYEVFTIILIVLTNRAVIQFPVTFTIMSTTVSVVIVLECVVVLVVFAAEFIAALWWYIKQLRAAREQQQSSVAETSEATTSSSSSSSSLSVMRWIQSFLLDRPTMCRLERIFIVPICFIAVTCMVYYACRECFATQAFIALHLISKILFLMFPGGGLLLFLITVGTISSACRRAKAEKYEEERAAGKSTAETFGAFMVKLLTSDKKRRKRELFMRFAAREWSTENITCAIELLRMQKLPTGSKQKFEAWRSIVSTFVERNAPLEVNLAGPVRTAVLSTANDKELVDKASQQLLRATMANLYDTYQRFKSM